MKKKWLQEKPSKWIATKHPLFHRQTRAPWQKSKRKFSFSDPLNFKPFGRWDWRLCSHQLLLDTAAVAIKAWSIVKKSKAEVERKLSKQFMGKKKKTAQGDACSSAKHLLLLAGPRIAGTGAKCRTRAGGSSQQVSVVDEQQYGAWSVAASETPRRGVRAGRRQTWKSACGRRIFGISQATR